MFNIKPIISGQLTQEQKDYQMKNQKFISVEPTFEVQDIRSKCFSERLRRKSVCLNNVLGKHIRDTIKRRPSLITRTKVIRSLNL